MWGVLSPPPSSSDDGPSTGLRASLVEAMAIASTVAKGKMSSDPLLNSFEDTRRKMRDLGELGNNELWELSYEELLKAMEEDYKVHNHMNELAVAFMGVHLMGIRASYQIRKARKAKKDLLELAPWLPELERGEIFNSEQTECLFRRSPLWTRSART